MLFQCCWIQPHPLQPSLRKTQGLWEHGASHSTWWGNKVVNDCENTHTSHRDTWPETLIDCKSLELKERLWLCRRTNDHFLPSIPFYILHLAKTFFANYLVGWHKHKINFSSLLGFFILFQTWRQTVSQSIWALFLSVTSVGLIKCTTFFSQSPVSIIPLDL